MANNSTHSRSTDITYTGSNTDKNNSWKENMAQIIFDAWHFLMLGKFFLMPYHADNIGIQSDPGLELRGLESIYSKTMVMSTIPSKRVFWITSLATRNILLCNATIASVSCPLPFPT